MATLFVSKKVSQELLDKWQLLYVVDDHHDVIEAIRSFF